MCSVRVKHLGRLQLRLEHCYCMLWTKKKLALCCSFSSKTSDCRHYTFQVRANWLYATRHLRYVFRERSSSGKRTYTLPAHIECSLFDELDNVEALHLVLHSGLPFILFPSPTPSNNLNISIRSSYTKIASATQKQMTPPSSSFVTPVFGVASSPLSQCVHIALQQPI